MASAGSPTPGTWVRATVSEERTTLQGPVEVEPIEVERPVPLAPGLVRVTAANPGVMTGPGTNTYLVGRDELVVVDPGPDDPAHLDAVEAAGGGRIAWIVVTHTHRDHAPGAGELARRTGAARLGFASRDGFVADKVIGDGFEVRVPGAVLRAVHTPGHASNHLCFVWEGGLADGTAAAGARASGGTAGSGGGTARAEAGTAGSGGGTATGSVAGQDRSGGSRLRRVLLSGDHVMQGSTVVIAPPDGDMAVYLHSLRLVRDLPGLDAIAPGHGHVIGDPAAAVERIIKHRLDREDKVAGALRAAGSATVDELVASVYDDVDPDRHPIARRSLWAHLRKLVGEGRVSTADPDDDATCWHWGVAEPSHQYG